MRAILFFLLLFSIASAAFVRTHLYMQVQINEDGSADVREELRFLMDSAASIDIYRVYIKSTNDISGWRGITGLSDVRYHTDSANVQITGTRIQPSGPDTCSAELNRCYGTFLIEYKIKQPSEGKGIVEIEKYKRPRVLGYNLEKNALLLEFAPTGEQYLPEFTTLEIRIPKDSRVISVKPKPVEYEEAIPKGANKFTWQGRISLVVLELVYERKESLLSEVDAFFGELQSTTISWIGSKEGIAVIVSLVVFAIAISFLRKKEK